ncbi:ATP-binding protein [Gimesia sp.]|uniref:PAS domain-containing sensor histidine kinase n=1 Tax=Gimesia sp. TaxID=2024833 RepID=UPI003A8F151E
MTGEFSADCFRAIANYTYDWESWHAPNGRLLWVNATVTRMTGYTPEECLVMKDYPLQLVAEEDRPKISEILSSALQGKIGNDVEFRTVHRDGRCLWMAVSWQPIYNDSGTHLGFRTSIRDITERHELKEQLRLHAAHLEQLVQERTARITQLEINRRKMEKLAALGQLAAGVAHEVNNPLAGIRNAFALFKADISPDNEHYELLELIDSEIERIRSITHQMYQLYRPSSQEATTFSLHRAVEDVVCLSQSAATKAGVEIKYESTQEETQVTLPEGEVKQILLNLIRNAIQASPEGAGVYLETNPTDTAISVVVRDHGHGIQPADLPQIFDPFFTTKTGQAKQGMGLGLSVSRSLIEAMGGTLEVTSQPGQGAAFSAIFPRSH